MYITFLVLYLQSNKMIVCRVCVLKEVEDVSLLHLNYQGNEVLLCSSREDSRIVYFTLHGIFFIPLQKKFGRFLGQCNEANTVMLRCLKKEVILRGFCYSVEICHHRLKSHPIPYYLSFSHRIQHDPEVAAIIYFPLMIVFCDFSVKRRGKQITRKHNPLNVG
jgi:hypothetical protein